MDRAYLISIPRDLRVPIRLPSYAEYLGGISYVLPYEEQAAGLYRAIVDDTVDTWVTANQMWMNHL